jgi:hypothetical protein
MYTLHANPADVNPIADAPEAPADADWDLDGPGPEDAAWWASQNAEADEAGPEPNGTRIMLGDEPQGLAADRARHPFHALL